MCWRDGLVYLAIIALTIGGGLGVAACGGEDEPEGQNQQTNDDNDGQQNDDNDNEDNDQNDDNDNNDEPGETSCLEVMPADGIDFGTIPVDESTSGSATINNCDDDNDLVLEDVSIADGDGAFSLEEDVAEDLAVPPGDSTVVDIEFTPTEATDYEADLRIDSNAGDHPNYELALTGEGTETDCPVAIATASVDGSDPASSIEATSDDIVQLSGADSYDPDGGELTYEWSVITRPPASVASVADSEAEETEFEPDSIGQYAVELNVVDQTGEPACEPDVVDVEVVPASEVHVQLTWDAPDNPSDDVPNLNLVYKRDGDDWGSTDTLAWDQSDQDWGDDGVASHNLDSADGEVPEEIEHADPAVGRTYNLGVHYSCFGAESGTAQAQVRIWIEGALAAEPQRPLEDLDQFWHVVDVQWDDDPELAEVDDLQDSFDAVDDCP